MLRKNQIKNVFINASNVWIDSRISFDLNLIAWSAVAMGVFKISIPVIASPVRIMTINQNQYRIKMAGPLVVTYAPKRKIFLCWMIKSPLSRAAFWTKKLYNFPSRSSSFATALRTVFKVFRSL